MFYREYTKMFHFFLPGGCSMIGYWASDINTCLL